MYWAKNFTLYFFFFKFLRDMKSIATLLSRRTKRKVSVVLPSPSLSFNLPTLAKCRWQEHRKAAPHATRKVIREVYGVDEEVGAMEDDGATVGDRFFLPLYPIVALSFVPAVVQAPAHFMTCHSQHWSLVVL